MEKLKQSEVDIFHLEMCKRSDFLSTSYPKAFGVVRVGPPDASFNRDSYAAVGAQWNWMDRTVWSEGDWESYVHRETVSTYVGKLDAVDISYFELQIQTGGDVEIVYFGLFPEFIGKGLGGVLLTAAVECAWKFPGTSRVCVHTCSRDHPNALGNYQARGFRLFKTVRERVD